MLTVSSVNVNGLRAAVRKGMDTWLLANRPDVVTLQEVRCPDQLVADLLGAGWHVAHAECSVRGRAGVAIASRSALGAVQVGLGVGGCDDSGRWIEAQAATTDGSPLTVVSAYAHTGHAEHGPRMAEKHAFLRAVIERSVDLREAGQLVLLTGDLNVAHREVDLRNWRGNRRRAGFLPEERAHLDHLFDELGWVDLGRRFGGWGPGPYTWWSNRGGSYDRDVGWRIDYQIASPELAPLAKDTFVDRAPTHPERWSDHAPVTSFFDL